MKNRAMTIALIFVCTFVISASAEAHFGMIIPSDQMVMQGESKTIGLDLMFWHPFEGQGMNLDRPAAFGLVYSGKKKDLLGTLEEKKIGQHKAWEASYKINRPGVYIFYMEPKPYWEPAEDCFIVHYTKVYVAAFGDDEGWDRPVGLKAEIVPLSKPYGLWAGNVFQGRVMFKGKPIPWAEVEIEYYSPDAPGQAPSDFMITQTVKADANGVFTYAAPKAGWWGFAALMTDDRKLKQGGREKDVEIGAVIWVKFHEMR